MKKNFAIKCSCGALQGSADTAPGDRRLSCYCNDCQSFAYFLERAGEVLDAHGGTDVYQMSPARLQIGTGAQHLGCLRLRPNGLLRWYATCCGTPIGNTLATHKVPFVGLVTACIDCTPDERTDILGPPKKGVHGRFAKGNREGINAHERAPLSLILSSLGKILMLRLRGDHKHSPFFDKGTGKPNATPLVLSETRLHEVERARDGVKPGD